MALLDDIKVICRVTTDALDVEFEMLIDAALADLEDKGIDESLLVLNEDDNLDNMQVKTAVATYVKEKFGYDNSEADRFGRSYDSQVVHLMLHHNSLEADE